MVAVAVAAMPNPFVFITELREMNESLTARLEEIIQRLDILIDLERNDLYGDGK